MISVSEKYQDTLVTSNLSSGCVHCVWCGGKFEIVSDRKFYLHRLSQHRMFQMLPRLVECYRDLSCFHLINDPRSEWGFLVTPGFFPHLPFILYGSFFLEISFNALTISMWPLSPFWLLFSSKVLGKTKGGSLNEPRVPEGPEGRQKQHFARMTK